MYEALERCGTALAEFYLKHRLSEDEVSSYPFPRIEKGVKNGELEIDSIYDIATNKLHFLKLAKSLEKDIFK